MGSLTKIVSVLSFTILFLLPSAFTIYAAKNCDIDPAPFMKLLNDSISNVMRHELAKSSHLLNIAARVAFCDYKVEQAHSKVYDDLSKLNELFGTVDNIESRFEFGDVTGLADLARKAYDELDSIRLSFRIHVLKYLEALRTYSSDSIVFFEYRRKILFNVNNLELEIDNSMERLADIYAAITSGLSSSSMNVSVSYKNPIYFGEDTQISLSLAFDNYSNSEITEKVNVKVSLIIGNVLEIARNVFTEVPANISVAFHVPEVGKVLLAGVEPLQIMESNEYYVPSKLVIKVIDAGTSRLIDFKIFSTEVIAERPTIVFKVPQYVVYNGYINVNVSSRAVIPLNVSVYLDKVDNESLVIKTIVPPGRSFIKIPLSNASVGYHTLIFVSEAEGRYIRSRWSSAIVIGSPSLPVSLRAPAVIVVPPFSFLISGNVEAPLREFTVDIFIDSSRVYHGIFQGGSFSAIIDMPITLSSLFIGVSSIKVVISSPDSAEESVYIVRAMVVNSLSTLVLVGIAGALYIHPRVYEAISFITKALILRSGSRRGRPTLRLRGSRTFRPFRLKAYFMRVISALTGVVDPPAAHETLREYLRRALPHIPPGLVNAVSRFFGLVELDLYSNKDIDEDEARELAAEIASMEVDEE